MNNEYYLSERHQKIKINASEKLSEFNNFITTFMKEKLNKDIRELLHDENLYLKIKKIGSIKI